MGKRTEKEIQPDWKVLLVGGSSGVGKTIVTRQLGLLFGSSWLQVDDFRLAFQRSRVTLPEQTPALYFFEETPNVWDLQPEDLCERFIAVSQVLSPALEVVIENHVDTDAPAVIEGDGILPSLFARQAVQERAQRGQVRAIFLVEPEEETILASIGARNRGIADRTAASLRTEARAKWLYGQWLAEEARRYGLPVVESCPWSTLLERIIAIISNFSN